MHVLWCHTLYIYNPGFYIRLMLTLDTQLLPLTQGEFSHLHEKYIKRLPVNYKKFMTCVCIKQSSGEPICVSVREMLKLYARSLLKKIS